MGILKKLFDTEYKELKRFEKLANEIEALSPEMEALKDEDFAKKTEEFKKEYAKTENLDDILVPAMALAREACFRGIGKNHSMFK